MNIVTTFCYVFVCSAFTTAKFTGSASKMYLSIMSGLVSNEPNLQKLSQQGFKTKQDIIHQYSFPITNNPELKYEFAFYCLELANDRVIMQNIFAFSAKGDIVFGEIYSFKKPENFEFGRFNASDLQSLSLNDLIVREECKFIMERIDETVFAANLPDCSGDTVSQSYTMQFSCNALVFTSDSAEFPEHTSGIPYSLTKVESYPVPDSVMPDYDKYKSLCHY